MANKDLWDMSDDEIEAAFLEAKASEQSPDTQFETELDNTSMDVEDLNDVPEDEGTEEFDDGLEQPEDTEDSDHDTSTDEEEGDSDEEDETDSELDEDSDNDTTETEPEIEEEQPAQPYKFKANGKDYEFSSEEIVEQFPKIFGQAMDYTKKMQAIKPWRKTIDAIDGAKLNHNDINLMIDVLKGDKGAISEVLKRTGVDALELDTDETNPYVVKDYGRDDDALAIKDVVDIISKDPEYQVTQNILSNEWDETSWNTFAKDPEMIKLLHEDVKSGMYTTLQPVAEKLKLFDGGKKSDLEYYKQAAGQYFTKVNREEEHNARQQELVNKQAAEKDRLEKIKAQSAKRKATAEASTKRKAAAPTKNVASSRNLVDYLDDSDEAFDEWYKKVQEGL